MLYWSYDCNERDGRCEVGGIVNINNHYGDDDDDSDNDDDDNDDGDDNSDGSTNPSARRNRVVWERLSIMVKMVGLVKECVRIYRVI